MSSVAHGRCSCVVLLVGICFGIFPIGKLKYLSFQGVEMQPAHVTAFQEAILRGDWSQALSILPQLSPDETTLSQARFWVLRQKYIEAVEAGNTTAALGTLRGELAPLQVQQAELRMLASEGPPLVPCSMHETGLIDVRLCIMKYQVHKRCTDGKEICTRGTGIGELHRDEMHSALGQCLQLCKHTSFPDDILSVLIYTTACTGMLLKDPSHAREAAGWGHDSTRSALVASLQRLLPPTLMVPDGRLESLVEQALDSQVCMLAASAGELSIDGGLSMQVCRALQSAPYWPNQSRTSNEFELKLQHRPATYTHVMHPRQHNVA